MTMTLAHARRLAIYLLVFPLLTSCERSAQQSSAKPHAMRDLLIVAVGPGDDHPQWPAVRGGVERLLADIPSLRGQCIAAADETAEALHAAVERALAGKPNVICLFVADVAAARPCIDLIAKQQRVLVTMGKATGDPRVAGHVGVDPPAAAEELGENLSRIAAGSQTYLLLHEAGRSDVARNCYRRFSAAAQRRYELTLLQAADASAGGQTPSRLVEQMLGLFPHAGLLVTLDPDVWLTAPSGWLARLHELNREFRFTTLSTAPRLWPRLGTPAAPGDAAALLGPLDGDMGYKAAQLAVQLMISTDKPPARITIPCELVTPENLADFAHRYAAAAGSNLDAPAFRR